MRFWLMTSLMAVGVVWGTTAQACPMIGEAAGSMTAVGSATGIVARLVDGETLALSDGRLIRLEGALVPRAIDAGAVAGTWPAELAVTAWLSPLVIGKAVVIVSGPIQGAGGDGEARRLRHVVAQVAVEEADGRRWWLQGAMVEQGHARVYRASMIALCLDALLSLEAMARERRVGLWALGGYRVIDLAVEPLPEGLETTFQIVRGRVLSVFRTRSGVMLRMARRWGGARGGAGVMASAHRGDGAVERLIGRRSGALSGAEVEARGWVVRRPSERGLVIDVSLGGWLAVLRRDGLPGNSDAGTAEARGKAGVFIDVVGDMVVHDGGMDATANSLHAKTPGR